MAHRFSAAPSTSIGTHRLCASQADYLLPSRSRIAALLKAEHLTRRYQKHSELPLSPIQSCFLGQPASSATIITIAPQGLTKTDLMGELGHLLALPAYQLVLPFTHEAWRQLEYTHVLAGTTF